MNAFVYASIAVLLATSAYAEKATPGKCLAAVSEAQANDNVWQSDLPMSECRRIAAEMVDAGMMAGSADPVIQKRGLRKIEDLYR